MDVEVEKTVKFTLSEKDAKLLLGIMQNPLFGEENPDAEDPAIKNFRYKIFNSIRKALFENHIGTF